MLSHIFAILASYLLVLYAVEHKDVQAQQRVEADKAVAINDRRLVVLFGASQIEVGTTPNRAQEQEEYK